MTNVTTFLKIILTFKFKKKIEKMRVKKIIVVTLRMGFRHLERFCTYLLHSFGRRESSTKEKESVGLGG